MKKYDITIIGAGPGGYVAALYAAQLGKKVCLVEMESLGGVCLNWGCIPTKSLITSAKTMALIRESEKLGINSGKPTIDFSAVMNRTWSIVDKLKKGIEALLKLRKVDFLSGKAFVETPHTVRVNDLALETENIIIATGSSPVEIPGVKIDENAVVSNKGMLKAASIPQELLIIGGGAIGCEFASIFNEFGSRVTIVEMMPHLIPGSDEELSKRLEAAFKKQRVNIATGAKVESVRYADDGRVAVQVSNGDKVICDKVLVSVGRRPNVEGFGLENLGIEVDRKGVKVDDRMRTKLPNVYAIGDCIGGFLLAHIASYEGIVACDNICGKENRVDYGSVPYCIFTEPEIASCGMNESSAKTNGMDVKVSRFFFRSLGKAHAIGKTDGYVKIVTDNATGKIIGADIMGEGASDMISEITLAVRKGMQAKDITSVIHAHPTMAEGVLEAAHIAEGKPLHSA